MFQCEPILHKFNFRWPAILDCSNLPERSDRGQLCMEAPSTDDAPYLDGAHAVPGGYTQNPEWIRLLEALRGRSAGALPGGVPRTTPVSGRSTDVCPPRFVYVAAIDAATGNDSCAPRCDVDVYFRREDKQFASVWMLVWAACCMASTVVMVLTFLIDTSRFRYPERPIIFIAMCYSMYSLAYLLGAVLGRPAVACTATPSGESFLIQRGVQSTWCIVTFLLLYFFGMAGAIWWVVLAVTWFLAAAKKWSREAITSLGSYFHLAAWAVPAVKTIVVLVMRRVDGDELTGLCYVGNHDPAALVGFVLVPLLAYLLIGTVFIGAGFAAMCRIRHDLRGDGLDIRKLEKLMAKIGVFSVLYTVPATCVLGCTGYALLHERLWREAARASRCHVTPGAGDAAAACAPLERSVPAVEVFMLRVFMSLVVGVTSGTWIWSSKTLASWRSFCARSLFRRRQPRKATALTSFPPLQPLTAHDKAAAGKRTVAATNASLQRPGSAGRVGQPHVQYHKCANTNPICTSRV